MWAHGVTQHALAAASGNGLFDNMRLAYKDVDVLPSISQQYGSGP
jgi:hypothetical protein